MLFLYSEATALKENKQFNNKVFNFFKKRERDDLLLPCDNTARRWPSADREEGPHQELNQSAS